MEVFKVDESMKKADIIKVARAAIQEVKKLRKQSASVSSEDMPYEGVSVIKTDSGYMEVHLRFDLDTKAAVVVSSAEETDRPEMGAYRADKKLRDLMYNQKLEGGSDE